MSTNDEEIRKAMTREQANNLARRLGEHGTRRSVWWTFWAEQIKGTPFYRVIAKNDISGDRKEFFSYHEGRIVDKDWGLGCQRFGAPVGTRPSIFWLANKVQYLENQIAELKKTLSEITSVQQAKIKLIDSTGERAADE